MQIQLLSVMHKMHRALGSKHWRLFGRFLYIFLLLVGFFAFAFLTVKVHADGHLKLNTDVFLNNGSGVGSNGEFAIRGQLFSKDLDMQIKQLQEQQSQTVQQKKKIDFEHKQLQNFDTKIMTSSLFQNYQPQQVTTDTTTDQKQGMNFYILSIIGGIMFLLLGIVIGNRRMKRKWRQKRV